MKKIILLSLTALLIFTGSVRADKTAAAARKETARLAAKLLVEELRKNLSQAPVDTKFLTGEMDSNRKLYQSPGKASAELQKSLEKNLRRKYREEIKRIIAKINSEHPDGKVQWFTKQEIAEFNEFPQKPFERNLSKKFPSVFKKIRKNLCARQWKRLELDCYPTEVEFDKTSPAQLKKILTKRLVKRQKEVLYQENIQRLGRDFISKVISDANRQRRNQLQHVRKSTGGTAIAPDNIGENIRLELTTIQKKQAANFKPRPGMPNKTYGTFPSVAGIIPGRAEKVAVAKFINWVKKRQFPVSSGKVEKIILKDPAGHQEPGKSFATCNRILTPELQKQAVGNYAGKLSGKSKAALETLLIKEIQTNNQAKKVMNTVVERSLRQPFIESRKKISELQFDNNFQPLVSRIWRADDQTIEKYFRKPGIVHLKNPLNLPGIRNRKTDNKKLLLETGAKVSDSVDDLLHEGRQALSAQMTIVEVVQDEIQGKIQPKKIQPESGFFGRMLEYLSLKNKPPLLLVLPPEDKLLAEYDGKVTDKWRESRIATLWGNPANAPENRETKYLELFPKVKANIRMRVRAMLDRENRRLKAKAEIAEEKSKPRDSKSEPQVPESKLPELKIILSGQHNQLQAVCAFKGKTGKFTSKGNVNAGSKFFRELSGEFSRWLVSGGRAGKVSGKVNVVIMSPKLYYGTAEAVRECFLSSLKQNGLNAEIEWSESLKSQKGKLSGNSWKMKIGNAVSK